MPRFDPAGHLVQPFFGTRPAAPTFSYLLNSEIPRRPDPALATEGEFRAEPDRYQHTYADRTHAACYMMTATGEMPNPVKHAAVSLRLDERYTGPLMATYKVAQDVLDRRARVLARDDNCLRVPELHVSRDLPIRAGNVVTVVDLVTETFHSREFVATPQPYRVATDGQHNYHFGQQAMKTPDDYREHCVRIGALMMPVAAAHPPVGHLPDDVLKDASLTIVVHGLASKRDLDNCVLAVMDAMQAAREDASNSATSIDRLVRQVHAYVMSGDSSVGVDIQSPVFLSY